MKGFGEQRKSKKIKGKINTNKSSKEQIINQGINFHLQGNFTEALKYYQYLLNQGFIDHRILSNYGALLKDIGKLKEAELYTRKAIELNPNHANAHSNLGNILIDLGKLKEAELYTRKAIELNPNHANAHSNLGNILIDLGKLKEAELYTRKAIELNPNNANAHSNLGSILKDLGKLKDAGLHANKAIELSPKQASYHSNLGIILKKLGKLEEAELSTRKAVELNPNLAIAHNNLGSILKDLGKLKDAILHANKAIKLNPNYSNAYSTLGTILIDLGKIKDAELCIRKAIELNPNNANAHCNLGNILKDTGKLKDAELYTRKSIELNPNNANSHCNLGHIFTDLGRLKEAELSIQKALEINPNLTRAYFSLSYIIPSNSNKKLLDKLFSETILNNKLPKEKVDIYFARANFFHKEKNYQDSAKSLEKANQTKLNIKKSNSDILINKSKSLLIKSNENEFKNIEDTKCFESIFIVGMPRSGSTLLESILSMNTNVYDLGETNILEESFKKWVTINQKSTLSELYWEKIKYLTREYKITTNKNLYNYQYVGLIIKQIPNAKIIHCYRNPLDNILSIYRTYFAKGNEYSSSLIDCARVYLDQEKIMQEYKNKFRSSIYDLNYDFLVKNPNIEIKSLINWLGWQWNDSYLSPHLNKRSVVTASSVQVRFPINSQSIDGWKNYKDMLKPAIKIIGNTYKYRNLISAVEKDS
ncbi:tetratricopeptide repeat-containing sulfotransferase family protein [Prochlorococcus marinus]|uniref:tetratricopeptide repeat-containing sulfotransferase family protein n=1 Tax=Prochlorococcus marinus TaxID=1219 RepID=UPI0022B3135A|nr:tetratricopeptide repeat-containing sulfotransferase family protein [Prochlorococcus marinus]